MAISPTTGLLTTVTPPKPTTGANQPQTRLGYTALHAWYRNSGGIVQASPVTLLTSTSACQTRSPPCAGTIDEARATIAYQAGSAGQESNLAMASVTSSAGDGSLSATNSLTHDQYGNVATTVGALGAGQTTALFYDLNRNATGAIGSLPTGHSTYPAVNVTYNANNQPTLIATGTTTSQTSLSSFASLEQGTIAYDALGRAIQASQASGGTTNSLSQYTFDNANRLVCAAVRMNAAAFASPPVSACLQGTAGPAGPDRIAYATYDAADQLAKVTAGFLSTSQIDSETLTWTRDGLIGTVADANGNVTTEVHDGFNRLCAVEYPGTSQNTCPPTSGDWVGYSYDANGNVTQVRQRSGDTITLAYDALNRVTSKSFSADANENVAYAWDLLGRPTSAQFTRSGGIQAAYAWDALSRLTGETTAGRALAYGYDAAGDRTGITWPDAAPNALSATYAYDYLGRVTQILANGASLATYGYDDLGRRNALTASNSTAAAYGWDGADRLTSLAQSFTSTSNNVTFTLGYDPANEVLTRAVTNDAYTATPAASSATYVANALNQYAAVNGVSSTYDARGNTTFLVRAGMRGDTAKVLVNLRRETLALARRAVGA